LHARFWWENLKERNTKVHHRIYNSPPLSPILSQICPVHARTSHFLKTHFNIILQSTPGTCKLPDKSFAESKTPCIEIRKVKKKVKGAEFTEIFD
jgi:hypothetical protein